MDPEANTPPEVPARTTGIQKKKQLGFVLPTLHIPPPYPQTPEQSLPRSANTQSALSSLPSENDYRYPRKASEFMFSQFNGIKDFTKSGLGIGEKSAFWLYNKVSSWSKQWFTHIFLSVVIVLYTVGGAAMFVAIEGKRLLSAIYWLLC